jgi:hypothetical protein
LYVLGHEVSTTKAPPNVALELPGQSANHALGAQNSPSAPLAVSRAAPSVASVPSWLLRRLTLHVGITDESRGSFDRKVTDRGDPPEFKRHTGA